MNHPHDSICGCSITDVHKDNEYRFNQVRHIGTEILEENIKDICNKIDTSVFKEGFTVTLFNCNQTDYEGIVTADIEVPGKLEHEWDIKKPANILLLDRDGNAVPYQILEVKKNRMKRVNEYRRAPKWDVNDVYSIAFEASVPALGYTCYSAVFKFV